MLSRLSVDAEVWRNQRPVRVVTVGRFQPQKGFDDLFAAAKLLKDENIEFVVVGFGPLDVRALAKAAGVEHKVVFFDKLGQAQLQLMYQCCDMYCLPSITHPEQGKEGVPVVLMEAMACGLPVVATRCGAVDEIVENILVDEHSPEQLAQAIKKLALDPELRREHGQRNRRIVEEKYSSANVERFAQSLLSLDKVNK
jgi:glycosyltransferase involved in cell wall biosynthesis